MKGFMIFSIALLCVVTGKSQAKFGIFAGPHTSSAIYSVDGFKQSTDYKFGFHLGAGFKIPFENQLSFSPAISYKMMGYKVVFSNPSFPPDLLAKDNNTRFHEIDVDLLLQCDLGKQKNHLFLRAGPSFNFILGGKEKFHLATGEYIDRSMKFSVINGYGPYGTSVVGQFGFETSGGFIIYAHYLQGLISMNNEDNGPTIKNHLLGLSFGMFFKSKRQKDSQ